MANVGKAASGHTLIGQTVNQSPKFAALGTDSGLTEDGIVLGGGSNPFTSTDKPLDGELVIGSTAGSPSTSTLTADTGVTITNASNSITIGIDGAVVGETITGDSGGALSPTAGNWDILGLGETSTSGSISTLSVLSPRVSQYIVDPTLNNGTHQTITAAIAAASSGDTIFIRPGTYTENLTGKDGVLLCSFMGSSIEPSVEIIGKLTLASGVMYLSGIRLTTNGDYCLEATGTAGYSLNYCFIQAEDNDAINNSGTGAIGLKNCSGNTGTTGVKICDVSGGGSVNFRYSNFGNGGVSTTASTVSSGSIQVQNCEIAIPFSTSGSASIGIRNSRLDNGGINTATLTTSGTGTSYITNSNIESGTASVVSIGSGTTVRCFNSSLNSSNTNVVTGAGTFSYSNISLNGTSTLVNPTSSNLVASFPGKISFNSGLDYLQNYDEGSWTPSLLGSGANPTITYTTQVGTYTRIGDVCYLKGNIVINTTSGGSGNLQITGIPFTTRNDGESQYGSIFADGMNWDAASVIVASATPNQTYLTINGMTNNAGGATIDVDDIANGDSIRITMMYWI